MRLYSPKLELTTLRSVMSGDDRVASWILPRVTEEHFDLDTTKETYKRMMALVRRDGQIPHWDDIVEDMKLSQDTREELTSAPVEAIRSRKLARRIVDKLDEYRRVRVFYDASRHIAKVLKADKVDLDELTDHIGDFLFRARTASDLSECMIHAGDDKLDVNFVRSMLVGREQEFLPTGYKAFDTKNQGVPRGSLWLMAGTTGGGKTTLLNNVLVHQARIGAKVCGVSLEMSREHNLRRILSNLTEIPLSILNNAKALTNDQRSRVLKTWIEYHKQVKRNGGRLTLLSPEEDVSMEDTLTLLKPYEYDNIGIDYVGLLKGMDGEDQARRLGSATRYAARYAATNDSIVTVLAQLSADGLIRYSRAMQEHAALAWQWSYVYGGDEREAKMITVKQPKARQLQAFDFNLMERFEICRFEDVDASLIEGAKKGSQAHDRKRGSNGRDNARGGNNRRDTRRPQREQENEGAVFQM